MNGTPYTVEIKSEQEAQIYRFSSSDGILSKDEVRDSVLELMESTDLEGDENVLNIDCNYGIAGILTASSLNAGEVIMTNSSARAVKLAEMNVEENDIENAEVYLVPWIRELEPSEFDTVIYAPKPFDPDDIVKQKILEGMRKLRSEGEIVVSAHKKEGGKRYVEFLKNLSDEVQVISKSRGYRVVKAVKDREIEFREVFERYQWEEEIRGERCSFSSVPGLFSPKEFDAGSRKLVEEMEISPDDRVIDLACGYGTVGIYALKFSDCEVVFTDDDALATSYTAKNLSRNSLDAEVRTANALEKIEPGSFDKVLSNPPTHAGQGVIDEFFDGAFEALKEGGSFYLVYNDILDYEKQLESLFSQVGVLEDSEGFKVTRAIK